MWLSPPTYSGQTYIASYVPFVRTFVKLFIQIFVGEIVHYSFYKEYLFMAEYSANLRLFGHFTEHSAILPNIYPKLALKLMDFDCNFSSVVLNWPHIRLNVRIFGKMAEYSDVFEPRIFVFVRKDKLPFRLATAHLPVSNMRNRQLTFCCAWCLEPRG